MSLPSLKTLVSFLLLLSAASLSSYFLSTSSTSKEGDNTPELGLLYYLDDAELKGTGQNGELLFSIKADRAARSEEDNYINLTTVNLDYGPPKALPWKVSAKRGRITPRGKFIQLRGNVVATSVAEDSDPIVIRTAALNVESATLIARTDGDVTLKLGERTVDATGMEANFETNDLLLKSNVHGSFLP